MNQAVSACITLGVLIGGIACIGASTPAVRDQFDFKPNPFSLYRSPYGQVIAMAMQTPVDRYWHGGIESGGHAHTHSHAEGEHCEECDHDHESHDHDHENCAHCEEEKALAAEQAKNKGNLLDRTQKFITDLNRKAGERTNPRTTSKAHQFYLRRQVENKLRFAYDLDPTNYGNYAAYLFFLMEPGMGTRPVLSKDASLLCDQTIRRCLEEQNDPRPALTAAAAADNLLKLIIITPENFTEQYANTALTAFDASIARYDQLAARMKEDGTWDAISPQRHAEIEERRHFLEKLRKTNQIAISRLATEKKFRQFPNNN